jgi:hypothetical protein
MMYRQLIIASKKSTGEVKDLQLRNDRNRLFFFIIPEYRLLKYQFDKIFLY